MLKAYTIVECILHLSPGSLFESFLNILGVISGHMQENSEGNGHWVPKSHPGFMLDASAVALLGTCCYGQRR